MLLFITNHCVKYMARLRKKIFPTITGEEIQRRMPQANARKEKVLSLNMRPALL